MVLGIEGILSRWIILLFFEGGGVMRSIKISYEELLERYAAGERDFSNCRFWGDNELRGANLQGIILVNSDLSEHDLSGANLSGANLSGAGLEQAGFENANLSGANLSGAFLNQAQFIGANLTGAYLINACDIEFANFCKANLTDAILRNAMNEREPFILDDAIFYNTIMPNGSIRNEIIS
jgi:uncharacterized protein YjbI with pentapeptide repeats